MPAKCSSAKPRRLLGEDEEGELEGSGEAEVLELNAKTMSRERDTGARMDSLIRVVEKAQTGTNGDSRPVDVLSSGDGSGYEAA